jgi:hypothetical protein
MSARLPENHHNAKAYLEVSAINIFRFNLSGTADDGCHQPIPYALNLHRPHALLSGMHGSILSANNAATAQNSNNVIIH